MRKKIQPDCGKCLYHRSIPGDTFIACGHPRTRAIHKNDVASLLGNLEGSGPIGANLLSVEADPIGIEQGAFAWPFRFDPAWLRACGGYEALDGG